MAKEQKDQLNLTVVALVALVAIVGLVALVMNAGSISSIAQTDFATGVQSASAEDASGLTAENIEPLRKNVAGQALSGCALLAYEIQFGYDVFGPAAGRNYQKICT